VSEDYITISKMRWMKTNGQKRNGMECMNEWMKAQKNECRNEWLSWVNDSMNTRKNEWQNEWLHDRLCIYIYYIIVIHVYMHVCVCIYIYNYIHICSLYGRMELLSLLRGLSLTARVVAEWCKKLWRDHRWAKNFVVRRWKDVESSGIQFPQGGAP
jgi:hypothetical protein